MVVLQIDRVANGYTVRDMQNANTEDDSMAMIHIALTQDSVAGVVKQIIRGAFGADPKKEQKPAGKKADE